MARGALAGVRVIDLTHAWAGPHAARLLADFGAEVIKVEYFRRLDLMRGGRTDERRYDRNPAHLQVNRNKRSLALDLRDTHHRSIFDDLVQISDVVMSNAKPGVPERLGFDYPRLRKLKNDIILASLTAHGYAGPESSYVGYGGGMEGISGIQSLTGYDADSEPRRIREMDVMNGIMSAGAIMTALVHRQRTGEGAWIDRSFVETAMHSLVGEQFLEYFTNGHVAAPTGNRRPDRAPHGCYRCRGEDRWLTISVATEEQWSGLCKAAGHPEWRDDPRFASMTGRLANHDELDRLLSDWTGSREDREAMDMLQHWGVPAGVVNDVPGLVEDSDLRARGYFQSPPGDDAGPRYAGFPVHISPGGPRLRHGGPALNEAARYVVCELLGRPESDVVVLDEGEIGTDYDVPEDNEAAD